ncbi:hypothetical protein Fmac_030192 [Flemingia macrophylla]|uniref:Cytochrome P450 n=1 Tax=Flemingia macrophylla TaxID=520843 RepID=A0ABD1LCG5_9FABA
MAENCQEKEGKRRTEEDVQKKKNMHRLELCMSQILYHLAKVITLRRCKGHIGKFNKTSKALDQVFDQIIEEYNENPSATNKQNVQSKHFVDILLSLLHQPMDHNNQKHFIDRTNIKAILKDMPAASFDSSASAIEFAMSELLRHPRVMKKLQDELSNVVGINRLVEEFDLTKFPYLNMIVKETLRLYPIGVFVPRQSLEDITINGYLIKKKSSSLVNLWAIGRDPKVWSDTAEIFYPERFVNNNIDLKGHDFQLIRTIWFWLQRMSWNTIGYN